MYSVSLLPALSVFVPSTVNCQLSTDSHVKLVVFWNCVQVARWQGVRTNRSTCQRPLFSVCCYCVTIISATCLQCVLQPPEVHSLSCRNVMNKTNKQTNKGNCALLGYYAASSGNFLPTFRDNLSVPSSWPLKMGSIGCPETSVRKYHYSLRDDTEERSSHLLRGGRLKPQIDKGLNERQNVTA